MLWGDQWECRCGTNNNEFRERCRDCGVTKEEGFVRDTNFVGMPLDVQTTKPAT